MDNLTHIFSSDGTGLFIWFLMFAASFAGGVISSVSPCSLAMLPLIIGYIGGYSKETPRRTLIQLCSFIFGTAVIFSLIGIICAVTGKVFAAVLGGYFTLIIASILLVMGLKASGIMDFEFPVIIKSMPSGSPESLFVYPMLLGVAFALAGTPCSTPILAGITALAAMGKNIPAALIMLFLFALGQGLILIIAGFCTSGALKKFSGDLPIKISGYLLILAAVYLYYKVFAPMI